MEYTNLALILYIFQYSNFAFRQYINSVCGVKSSNDFHCGCSRLKPFCPFHMKSKQKSIVKIIITGLKSEYFIIMHEIISLIEMCDRENIEFSIIVTFKFITKQKRKLTKNNIIHFASTFKTNCLFLANTIFCGLLRMFCEIN